jgi:hypothetical protein
MKGYEGTRGDMKGHEGTRRDMKGHEGTQRDMKGYGRTRRDTKGHLHNIDEPQCAVLVGLDAYPFANVVKELELQLALQAFLRQLIKAAGSPLACDQLVGVGVNVIHIAANFGNHLQAAPVTSRHGIPAIQAPQRVEQCKRPDRP